MPARPRIPPLTPEQLTPRQSELLGGSPRPLNIFATLVRHPGLYRRWLPFAGKLLSRGRLPERDREIVILRTAWRCHCAYEWGQHVALARAAGLTDADIRAVAADPGDRPWPAGEGHLLRMVDQLTDTHRITDATWAALAARHDERQLIELPMLSGHYAMLAGALNSYGVPPEGPMPALGET